MTSSVRIGSLGGIVCFQVALCTPLQTMVTCMINIKLAFTDWFFFYNLIILIK